MARVLVISSWVTRGHVGLAGIVPVLQRRGFETIALPTVVLSNHLGHPHFAGSAVPVDQLHAMLSALEGNGWLSEVDAVLTGYLPTPGHVAFARDALGMVLGQNPKVLICCDPVLGDLPGGLYVPAEVADAVKTELLPVSHCSTPNRFELEWLAGAEAASPRQAVVAARAMGPPLVLATSIPAADGGLATIVADRTNAFAVTGPVLSEVPHGTGDVMAALFLAARLSGQGIDASLASAAGGIGALIGASLGAEELRLVATQDLWAEPTPAAVETI